MLPTTDRPNDRTEEQVAPKSPPPSLRWPASHPMCFDRLLDIYRRPSSLLRHHRQRKQLLLPFSRPVSIRVKKNVTKKKIKTKSKQSERERKNQRLPSIKRVRPSPSTDSAAAAATATAAAKFLKMMITHDEPDTRRDKVDSYSSS